MLTENDVPTATAAASEGRLVRLGMDDHRWREFVAADQGATALHNPSWPRFLADCYGFDPFAFALVEGDSVVAGIPLVQTRDPIRGRRWIALPYSDQCDMLARSGVAARRCTEGIDQARTAEGIGSLEIRGELPLGTGANVGYTHRLTLPAGGGEVAATHPSAIRYSIRTAERAGVTVRVAGSAHDLTHTFYALHVATRRRLGVPVQSRHYFRLLWDQLVEPGDGFVMIAERDGTPLAAGVFLHFNRHVLYKYGAADHAHRKLNANSALLHHAMRHAADSGFATFDWGRTSATDQGLRRFKASWGCDERPLVYTRLGEAGSGRSGGRAGEIARTTIRKSPPWVCRAVGALLYRYAA